MQGDSLLDILGEFIESVPLRNDGIVHALGDVIFLSPGDVNVDDLLRTTKNSLKQVGPSIR